MSGGLIDGFAELRLPGDGVAVSALVGGTGPPLLLLHGFPETRLVWKQVAPALACRYTVVVPDLRGYGRSDKPAGDDSHQSYSKLQMARDQVATMDALGFSRFAVVGHDRGARVAYRLALDHPGRVTKVAVLDILPTLDMWNSVAGDSALNDYHWFFLAQPYPLPETLLASDPEFFIRWTLSSWAADGFEFDSESLADYIQSFDDPASIHATCEDYRAGLSVDKDDDDRDFGRRFIRAPLLALWGAEYDVAEGRPLEAWSRWATDVRGGVIPGGHFLPEEAPTQVASALDQFLAE